MGKMVGIDLGTTNSVVAVIDKGRSSVVRNKEGEYHSPSIVTYYRDQILAGIPATRYLVMNHANTIVSVKRLMGRAYSDEEVQKVARHFGYRVVKPAEGTGTTDSLRVVMGGQEYAPEDISAIILKKLKEDFEDIRKEEVTHAVITVPAYFSDKQKQATWEAGVKAGLKVMKLLDEPMAAALAFGLNREDHQPQSVLVYDLGGGTFDTTVFVMGAGSFSQLNLEGDMWLGGDNFDQLIVDYVVDHIKEQHDYDPTGDARLMATLKLEARKAKDILSTSKITEIIADFKDEEGDTIDVIVDISQDWFMRVSEPLVDRTMNLVDKALAGAHMKREQIDVVVMAGNASAMPLVQAKMIEKFGEEKISKEVHPKHSVAMGAAIHAATYARISCPRCKTDNDLDAVKCEKCGFDLQGVDETKTCPACETENKADAEKCISCGFDFRLLLKAPFDYAVETAGDNFIPFVRKGDTIPTKTDKINTFTVYTRYPNQQLVSIPYYGMVETEEGIKKEKQGEAMAILPPGCKTDTPLLLTCWLGKESTMMLEAKRDNGDILVSWVMRGGKDQLVVETMAVNDGLLAEKEHLIQADARRQINKMMETVIQALSEKEFDQALATAMELRRLLENIILPPPPPPPPPPEDPIEQLKLLTLFLIRTYDWALGEEKVARLEQRLAELEIAQRQRDAERIDNCAYALMKELDDVNPLVYDLLEYKGRIAGEIRPMNPVAANQLDEELNNLENAFKCRQRDAEDKKVAFESKLDASMGKPTPPEIQCPKQECGRMNPRSRLTCERCGANLRIAKGTLGTNNRTIYTPLN